MFEMTPFDNVLYFPNGIDVRLCPKNGMTSIKLFYKSIKTQSDFKYIDYRTDQVHKRADIFDLPYRKDSVKVAVYRDPVERFISSCNYLRNTKHFATIPEEYDDVLDLLESDVLKDSHFYPQSWFLGSSEDYDLTFKLSELNRLFEYINSLCTIPVETVHENKSKGNNPYLSDENYDRIVQLYKQDYDNGWA